MTLSEGKIGKTYVVEEVHVDGPVTRRLEALGVNEQTGIVIQNSKRNGALIIKVRGTRLALGRRIADHIQVREA
ncbi:MAG: ferrous iron transport protein A [Lachnospiraceae bacterium]|nr:ferrous iron transport protein A [Lachnospiraceae bacterium]